MVAVLVRSWRFRGLVFASVLSCVVQVIRLIASHNDGIFGVEYQAQNATFFSKLVAGLMYSFGFLGSYIAGPREFEMARRHGEVCVIAVGVVFFSLIAAWVYRRRWATNPLIPIGLSMIFLDVFLNCFTLGAIGWDVTLEKFHPPLLLYRHVIVILFGSVFIITGFLDDCSQCAFAKKFEKFNPTFCLFLAWFVFSGWLTFGLHASLMPSNSLLSNSQEPMLGNSRWQALAPSIGRGENSLCVPIDPFGWFYLKNCTFLNPSVKEYKNIHFKAAALVGASSLMDMPVPNSVIGHKVISLGIMLKPDNIQKVPVSGHAVVTTVHGDSYEMAGENMIPPTGGLLLLTSASDLDPGEVKKVTVTFATPVAVAYGDFSDGEAPLTLWMGH